MSALFLVVVLIAVPLIPTLAKLLARLALRCLGWALRSKTAKRRTVIISRARTEEESYQANQIVGAKTEDEDWEQVEGYGGGSAPNGDLPSYADWKGIVGFFHPFWFVSRVQVPGVAY